jgi:Pyridine nucleotide-disulphide oxidoreductase
MTSEPIAIVGAGPYGLSAAAHLRRAGVEARIFGRPMSFWRSMPRGMMLRSNRSATCIVEHQGPLSIESYCEETGKPLDKPIPLATFIDYGDWVRKRVAEDLDTRLVVQIEREGKGFSLLLDDGERVGAPRVVVAGGIAPFQWRPPEFADLPADLASHTGDHRDLSTFAGRRVLVVGGGQSALESAALLSEIGADAEVLVRAEHINWLHGGKYHKKLGRLAPMVYAPTDVGPLGLSRLIALTDLYRRIPRRIQDPLTYRAIRPAGAAWLKPRLAEVPIRLNEALSAATPAGDGLRAQLSGGGTRTVDHVLFGTGYRVDICRYPFLSPELAGAIRQAAGYPVLKRGLESSVPRLHFLGAPAAFSFGPTMRFVSGSWYAGHELARGVNGSRGRSGDHIQERIMTDGEHR